MVLACTVVLTSCKDFLDVKSDSNFDSDFVFQSEPEAFKAVLGAYELLRSCGVSSGLRYDALAVGSDMEFHPEPFKVADRQESLHGYPGVITVDAGSAGSFQNIYAAIERCNEILAAFEDSPMYQAAKAKNVPSEMTHMYGEVIAIRAVMYYEVTKCWGDVPYLRKPVQNKADYENLTAVSRDQIQEDMINDLIAAQELMLVNSKLQQRQERISKGFAQGMIARIALLRGGWSLRPQDYNGDGEVTFANGGEWGKMVRRTDWVEYYKIADKYLKELRGSGEYNLTTNDPRKNGETEVFDNPFQYNFQQMMNLEICDESVFEISELKGSQSEFPYAYGRFSTSNSTSSGFPTKCYGSTRFLPQLFYGYYSNKDKRRDVSITGIGTSKAGGEALCTFTTGAGLNNGGFCVNKWDYARMADVTISINYPRKTGINNIYMRYADALLLLAETEAVLAGAGAGGDVAAAKDILKEIRQRAFDPADWQQEVTDYLSAVGNDPDAVLEAVLNERLLELAGEAQRRFDLVRNNLLAAKIVEARTEWNQIVQNIFDQGYHRFANGNEMPAFIWVKKFRTEADPANNVYKYPSRFTNTLTKTCYVSEADFAVAEAAVFAGTATAEQKETYDLHGLLYPGWRGNSNEWGAKAVSENFAIQGMFKHLTDDQIAKIEALGYEKVHWGQYYVTGATTTNPPALGDVSHFNWYDFFNGYTDADYRAGKALRYMIPIPSKTISTSKGKLQNHYGFPQQ